MTPVIVLPKTEPDAIEREPETIRLARVMVAPRPKLIARASHLKGIVK